MPTADNGESFRNEQVFYTDLSTGLNWHILQEDRLFWADIGVGVFHLARPNVSFDDQKESRLFRRFSYYGIGGFRINEKMDLVLHALVQTQGHSM